MKKIFYSLTAFILRYPTPTNLSFVWNFGVTSFLFLVIQILTGFFLSMYYVADADLAFVSVENIMRNVNYGYMIRYMHSNGASFFFICVYIHMLRSMYFKTYIHPRIAVWNVGVLILLLMIITAFTGYVLPWGQMSFWAATVITNLASAVPIIGDFIVVWLWGGYSVSTITLNRFFSIHYILPIVILMCVVIHVVLLHDRGSSNRLGIVFKMDKTMFHTKFTIKDIYFVMLVMLVYIFIVGFYPNLLSHPDNYVPADPLVTPEHIVPEWYFLPFYAILRSIPSKLIGVIFLLLSILIFMVLPFITSDLSNLDKSQGPILFTKLREKYNLWHEFKKVEPEILFPFKYYLSYLQLLTTRLITPYDWIYPALFWAFLTNCYILTVVGMKPTDHPYLTLGRLSTFFYFFYFFLLFIYAHIQTNKSYYYWYISAGEPFSDIEKYSAKLYNIIVKKSFYWMRYHLRKKWKMFVNLRIVRYLTKF